MASSKPPYSIVIPPPNVTGILHMGHVLNNTIQDILCRKARMEGREVLWLLGTDHAGILTQVQVAWKITKEEKLNRSVQLTISGCLGPCDLANVALVITPNGNEWLGGLAGDAGYDALVNWARECHREGRVLPLPAAFADRRFKRFGTRDKGDGG